MELEGQGRFGETERRREGCGGMRERETGQQPGRSEGTGEPGHDCQSGGTLLCRQKGTTEGLRDKPATCTKFLGLCWA